MEGHSVVISSASVMSLELKRTEQQRALATPVGEKDAWSVASTREVESYGGSSGETTPVSTPSEESQRGATRFNLLLPPSICPSRSLSQVSNSSSEQTTISAQAAPQLRIRNTFYEVSDSPPAQGAFARSRSAPSVLTRASREGAAEDAPMGRYGSAVDSTPTPAPQQHSLPLAFFAHDHSVAPVAASPSPSVPVVVLTPPASLPLWPVALPNLPAAAAQPQQQQQQQQQHGAASELQPDVDSAALENSEAAAAKRRPAPSASEERALSLVATACAMQRQNQGQRNTTVWSMARKDSNSSAVVQKAIELLADELESAGCDDEARAEVSFKIQAMLSGLHGHVHTALEHPHANYVVQKIVEVLPTEYIAFVISELRSKAVWAAQHRFGCRTILRLVHHVSSGRWGSQAAAKVIDELLPHTIDLTYDKFGNYVMQEVLEHGLPHQRRRVGQNLLRDAVGTSLTQHGSRVVEKALRLCDAPEVAALANVLLSGHSGHHQHHGGAVRHMACSECGCFVLRALVRSEVHYMQAALALRPLVAELRRTRQGRRLLAPVFKGAEAFDEED